MLDRAMLSSQSFSDFYQMELNIYNEDMRLQKVDCPPGNCSVEVQFMTNARPTGQLQNTRAHTCIVAVN